jgi:hypothetical protein
MSSGSPIYNQNTTSFCGGPLEYHQYLGVLVLPPEHYQFTTRLVAHENTTNTPLVFGGTTTGTLRHFISTSSGGDI